MIILDTDCVSLLTQENLLQSSKLQQRLDNFVPDEIFTTIITFEEQMRGWLSFVAKAKTAEQQIYAYQKLHRFLENYRTANVLDYDENAASVFKELKANKIRIGTMDLKIASIAISRKAILISRNLKDFEEVPNLVVQDWTK
jgi:tRNA(fMet)-specific endonuclease VapC